MVQSSRSDKRVHLVKKGQRQLAFLLALLSPISYVYGQSIFAGGVHKSSADLFYPEEWKSKGLRKDGQKIASHFDVGAGASVVAYDFDFELAQKLNGYFLGNGNIVFVGAKKKSIKLPVVDGIYPLNGEYFFLSSQRFTAAKDIQFSESFKIRIEPHVYSISDFHYAKSDMKLTVNGKKAQLSGDLLRIGTRKFGFLRNEAKDSGWGWGLNVQADYEAGPWELSARVNNLLSQMRFSVIHYSDRTYQASLQGGQVVDSGFAEYALKGKYGLMKENRHLPMQTDITVKNSYYPNFSFGVYGIDNFFVPWVGWEVGFGDWGFAVSSMKLKNLTLSTFWVPVQGLQAGIDLHYTKESKAQLASMFVKYQW